jgi:hypothetical protein
MKSYNSFISKNILLLCLFTGITSSLNHVKAQSDSLQIKSDTLFIKGIPQAKYFLSIVRGVDLNVEIQTYFFESEFRIKFAPYRKDFEKIVKQDLRSKGLFVNDFFFFKYYDISKLPIEYLQNDSVKVFSQTNSSFTDTAKIYLEQPFLYVDGKPVSIIRSQIDSLTLINQLRNFDDVRRLRMDLDFVSRRTSTAGGLLSVAFLMTAGNLLYLNFAKDDYNPNIGKILSIGSITFGLTGSMTLASSRWWSNPRYRPYLQGENYIY